MGFASGLSAGTQFRQQRQAEQQQQQLGGLAEQYYGGGQQQQVLGQIAGIDPQRAAFMQQQQYAQQQQEQKVQQQKMQRAGQLANTVLKADPRQRASVYKATLRAAEKYGMDVSDLPPEYTREVEPFLQSLQGMSGIKPEERKIIKDIGERQRYTDTGEYVFKDIKQTESPEQLAKKEEKIFNKETTLRKEFTANSKDFVKVRDAHNRIKASASDPSAAGDLALIFNYMKVLDPGSTVREGEFATAESSGSVPARIVARYNKVLEGERLAPGQRDDFVSRAEKLYGAQLKSQKKLRSDFGNIAKRVGVKKENVLLDFQTPEETTGQPQKPLSEMSIEELQALKQQMGGR